MAAALITLSLPTTRADGTPFPASDYGGAHILSNGQVLATLTAPALSFVDPSVVPGVTVYTATIFDTQTPPVVSAASGPVTAPSAPLAAPSAPGITVVLQ